MNELDKFTSIFNFQIKSKLKKIIKKTSQQKNKKLKIKIKIL